MLETLLSPKLDPLKTLTLQRCTLSRSKLTDSGASFRIGDAEALFYPLAGRALVTLDEGYSVIIGGRASVKAPNTGALRLAPGNWAVFVEPIGNEPVDFLLVSRENEGAPVTARPTMVFCQEHAWTTRQVGEGTHQRTVSDLVLPEGYQIAAGETLNVPGGWSSWPAHATEEDKQALLAGEVTWQEMFWVCTPGYGILSLDGFYHDGKRVQETRRVANGEALVTPLGSHPIVASPGDWLAYCWFYCGTALQKTYNAKATDVGVYVK